MANQSPRHTVRRAPRGALPSLTDRQLEAYLMARDTLRRLRALAPSASTARPPARP
jgi:hypothetical protein